MRRRDYPTAAASSYVALQKRRVARGSAAGLFKTDNGKSPCLRRQPIPRAYGAISRAGRRAEAEGPFPALLRSADRGPHAQGRRIHPPAQPPDSARIENRLAGDSPSAARIRCRSSAEIEGWLPLSSPRRGLAFFSSMRFGNDPCAGASSAWRRICVIWMASTGAVYAARRASWLMRCPAVVC